MRGSSSSSSQYFSNSQVVVIQVINPLPLIVNGNLWDGGLPVNIFTGSVGKSAAQWSLKTTGSSGQGVDSEKERRALIKEVLEGKW